ncbi:S1C family serine protease [Halothermothrix orenii]|uniref:2-alkenal reductase n=1 Tax=Halothermothrix orenii (strain H 168 / OCM 544 / DSM 9562) TaxID=373903 RepID=B8CZR8_HALOH|nr:trypsin-like peptidase domain-containing protein [Halothermothrix orenii]ACL70770.1 2-alkenal reductase [Halothermothrix orenii H 168]
MDSLFNKNNRKKINWYSFLWFVIIALLAGILIIYFVFPSMFKGPGVKRIPIIFEDESENKVKSRGNITEISKNVSRAVVKITTGKKPSFLFLKSEQRFGSGFIITDTGYILTNYHVVQGAEKISVVIPDREKVYSGKMVGADAKNDLALIKINEKELPFLELSTSRRLRAGELVIALGYPLGLENTLTVGVVSALNRNIYTENGQKLRNLIQVDVAINPGNSGGPLLNDQGQVIGINTAIIRQGFGIGFAIPISTVRGFLENYL